MKFITAILSLSIVALPISALAYPEHETRESEAGSADFYAGRPLAANRGNQYYTGFAVSSCYTSPGYGCALPYVDQQEAYRIETFSMAEPPSFDEWKEIVYTNE